MLAAAVFALALGLAALSGNRSEAPAETPAMTFMGP